MREAKFCTQLKKSFLAHGYWAYKIPDAPTRCRIAAPSDLVVSIDGRIALIECKLIKSISSYSNKLYRPSQIITFEELPDSSFAFVCVYKPSWSPRVRVHDVYVIPARRALNPELRLAQLTPLKFIKGQYDLQDFCEKVSGGFYEFCT